MQRVKSVLHHTKEIHLVPHCRQSDGTTLRMVRHERGDHVEGLPFVKENCLADRRALAWLDRA